MSRKKSSELVPRNGHTLVVLIMARISGCASRKELSLDDQVDHAKEEIGYLYEGAVDVRVVATKGRGERIDRPELAEVDAMLRTRAVDVLIMEDVGRLVRGVAAVEIWGIAVDFGTRCIAPNDCIDTIDESWEEELIAACRDHVGHNSQTSKRLKKKKIRFRRNGEAMALPILGYIKPDDAKSYDDWYLDESACEWIRRGRALLERTLNFTAVADFFNDNGVAKAPTGVPRSGADRWFGSSTRIHSSRACPRVEPGIPSSTARPAAASPFRTRLGRSTTRPLIWRSFRPRSSTSCNADYGRRTPTRDASRSMASTHSSGGLVPGPSPRASTHAVGTADETSSGANGSAAALMCNGSRSRQCWNSIGVPAEMLTRRIVEVIRRELAQLDGFDEQFEKLVGSARTDLPGISTELSNLSRERDRLERERRNVLDSIRFVRSGRDPNWAPNSTGSMRSRRRSSTAFGSSNDAPPMVP